MGLQCMGLGTHSSLNAQEPVFSLLVKTARIILSLHPWVSSYQGKIKTALTVSAKQLSSLPLLF